MMPEEWPIAAPAAEGPVPVHAAARSRLATVRTDFFLDPADRLSEQERALMTALLHGLVTEIAAELRAAVPQECVSAEDEDLVDRLARAGLLDSAPFVAILLRRSDEERISAAARARSGHRESRAVQSLVSHDDRGVSAAAMALILARGRRRDRFGRSLILFDDLPRSVAEPLAHIVAAGLRASGAGVAADRHLNEAADELLARHNPDRGIDALTAVLVERLDAAQAIGDDLLLACASEGDVGIIAAALGRRAGITPEDAGNELLSSDAAGVMTLLRVAGSSRTLAAGLLASVGDLIGIADPGEALAAFDAMAGEDVERAAARLRSASAYRAALDALQVRHG